ncbi:hypothetical protein P4G97_14755 [Bacillus cereus]|nr:hypothetical protein [Bacillus thuringiensis]MEB8714053.1 hypothetical protein [Bacillus cereus]
MLMRKGLPGCRFLSIDRYIKKIVDILQVTIDIFEKIVDIL